MARRRPADTAERLAVGSGARTLVTADVVVAMVDVDFLYTRLWVSMGEPADSRRERIGLLLPCQVNETLVELTGNPETRFMHCLPALHNRDTGLG